MGVFSDYAMRFGLRHDGLNYVPSTILASRRTCKVLGTARLARRTQYLALTQSGLSSLPPQDVAGDLVQKETTTTGFVGELGP